MQSKLQNEICGQVCLNLKLKLVGVSYINPLTLSVSTTYISTNELKRIVLNGIISLESSSSRQSSCMMRHALRGFGALSVI